MLPMTPGAELLMRGGRDLDFEVAAIDRQRVQFVREHFNKDTTDPSLYDLVLNTERFSVEQCADLIVEALHRLQAAVARKALEPAALPGAAH